MSLYFYQFVNSCHIFCGCQDYLDAFEKLLRLGLKNQQDREIIHVIINCCLQEKQFNPYYCYLSQKFCDFDRKYQVFSLQFCYKGLLLFT